MRLNPDKEKELRKYCSLEMQAALAEIDYLRSCLLDMEFVRGERDEYKRQVQVFSTARDRWMESSDKYKQLSQARGDRITKLRGALEQYCYRNPQYTGLSEKALAKDDLEAAKESKE